MAARHVRVTGRVQGVFFRGWTRKAASDLGVRGWVRNCSDGSVEAHLEGDPCSLDELIARMRIGPRDARVDQLSWTKAEEQDLPRFEVRH